MTLYTRKDTKNIQQIFQGEIISVRLDTLKHESGSVATREVVEHAGGVVIACRLNNGKIVLIRQYRYAMDEELIELPAGRINRGEDPLPAAKRELTEETGYLAQNWQLLSEMYTAPGFCDELLRLYLATDVSFVGKNLDEDEETDVLEVTADDAWQLVRQGKIRDAKTIAGIGLLRN